jgi:transcriptional regulator with XRE-family HTH domain
LVCGGGRVTDLQHALGAVVRRERRRRRRTMKWLAEKAGLSLVYLGEIERGKKYPSAPVLERLAWALDLPLPSFLQSIALALSMETQLEQQSPPTGPITLLARAA